LTAPLDWSGPVLIDPGRIITGVSCPSTSLCVATDNAGNVLTSADPAGGAGAWKVTSIEREAIVGVSCEGVSLCVAIDADGETFASTNPTGGAAAWSQTRGKTIAGLYLVTSISCVSGPLCVVSDVAGDVATSTDPTAGAGAWTTTKIDEGTQLNDVSCASSSLCVAVDNAGNVLSSTSPTAGAAAWSKIDVNGASPILGVACTTAPLCVAGGTTEREESPVVALTSTNPAGGAGAWAASVVPPEDHRFVDIGHSISCVAESLCVAVDDGSNGGLWQSGEPAAGAAAWSGSTPDVMFLESVSCATRSLCVIGDSKGNIVTSIETHALSVVLQGSGTGGVTSTAIGCPFFTCSDPLPPGVTLSSAIDNLACGNVIWPHSVGGTCALGYPIGSEVTLTATPSAGSVFAGWGGACQGSATSCSLTMTADEPVSASFLPEAPPVPTISDLSETARTWREGDALAQVTSRAGDERSLPRGTTFSFGLNVAARVTLTFARSARGRRAGGTCEAQTKRNEKGKRCTRTLIAGTLTFSARVGANTVRFAGLVSRHKRLKPGSYTLLVSAAASGEQSTPGMLHFTIASTRADRASRSGGLDALARGGFQDLLIE